MYTEETYCRRQKEVDHISVSSRLLIDHKENIISFLDRKAELTGDACFLEIEETTVKMKLSKDLMTVSYVSLDDEKKRSKPKDSR